jgi:RNA polymerase sigma-70 factor (ECF subfamily)
VLSERAFRALMSEHAPYVWRVLRSLGVAEADLPDVCQETFLVVHRRYEEFEGRSTLRTWICGVALRVASDYRGKAYRRREQPRDTLPELEEAAAQHVAVERRQAWQQLDALLAGLGEDQRRVFVLYEVEQLPMKDVAAIVACPLSTAYSRLHAAREVVREALARLRAEEGAP